MVILKIRRQIRLPNTPALPGYLERVARQLPEDASTALQAPEFVFLQEKNPTQFVVQALQPWIKNIDAFHSHHNPVMVGLKPAQIPPQIRRLLQNPEELHRYPEIVSGLFVFYSQRLQVTIHTPGCENKRYILIADMLRARRDILAESRSEFGARFGMPESSYLKYEQGFQAASTTRIAQIENAFHLQVGEIEWLRPEHRAYLSKRTCSDGVEIAHLLASAVASRNVSTDEICQSLKIPKNSLRKILTGKTKPNIIFITKLFEFLDLPADEAVKKFERMKRKGKTVCFKGPFFDDFGSQMELRRMRAGLTRVEFAKRSGLPLEVVSATESGRSLPSRESMRVLEKMLDWSEKEMLRRANIARQKAGKQSLPAFLENEIFRMESQSKTDLSELRKFVKEKIPYARDFTVEKATYLVQQGMDGAKLKPFVYLTNKPSRMALILSKEQKRKLGAQFAALAKSMGFSNSVALAHHLGLNTNPVRNWWLGKRLIEDPSPIEYLLGLKEGAISQQYQEAYMTEVHRRLGIAETATINTRIA